MSTGVTLGLIVILLAGNAFFVGAEFAIITARKDRLDAFATAGSYRAKTVLRASRQLPLLIAGAQLGVTVCSLGLGALAEPAIANVIERPLIPLGVPDLAVHGIAFAIALIIVSFLHTVLGEMVPKNLTLAGPERAAMWLIPTHFGFCQLVRPLLFVFTAIAKATLRLLRVVPKDELAGAYTTDELASFFGESRQEGLLDDLEHRRLAQTLASTRRTVADVLVPFDQLVTVPSNPTVGDVAEAVAATGFSRFPLRTNDQRLVGYLHVKDVLDQVTAAPDTPVPRSRMRGLPELPVDTKLDDALSALRRTQSHLAKAVGPGGEQLGVVAMEDMVEEYVGIVRDATHVARER